MPEPYEVYIAPRVRAALSSIFESRYVSRFWEVVDKLRLGRLDIPGLRVERLRTRRGKVYSARLNVEMRLIFSFYTCLQGKKKSLVIWDANHHDAAYDRVERAFIPALFDPDGDYLVLQLDSEDPDRDASRDLFAEKPDNEDLTEGLLLFRVPHFVLSEPEKYRSFERNIDRYLRLTEEQEELLARQDRSFLVQGAAGTGKTSLALFWALNLFERYLDDDIFFFTYQEELACVCRCYKVNLLGEEESPGAGGGLRVFSYLEFCRQYLKKNIDAKEINWQWIQKETSIAYLAEIIQSRTRWSRTITAEDTYGYIYSILKGRFVPGSDRLPESPEDFRRIFKGYGSVRDDLEDILEIFALYEKRLERKRQKDEADLIRYCYCRLKERAVLSTGHNSSWIVIDEIQDFTELEWKSILLFWENKCRLGESHPSFPFLSGDRNQNISASGFRWQEVDSYIESTLKQLHRPNSLQKVQLHRNFRNTRQIFSLGSFIRSLGPEPEADLGTAPCLEGNKVEVVIGSESDFLEFLTLIASKDRQPGAPPAVILFEDHESLPAITRQVALDEGIFLMPLESSKGMEFEDLIIYGLFSSLNKSNVSDDMRSRLFNLWYMGVMRARQNLLIYLRPEDESCLRRLLSDRLGEFTALTKVHEADPVDHLMSFFERREKYLPNYHVIFLERIKAQECFDEMRRLKDQPSRAQSLEAIEELKGKALKLWTRCRDYTKLGRAYLELKEFTEAVPFLKKAGLFKELGYAYESMGQFEPAAQTYEGEHLFQDAARCFESALNFAEAARIYQRLEDWIAAGKNFQLAGDNMAAALCFEKAHMWQEAADLYCSRSGFLKAAQMYVECARFEQAAEMYLKVKDKLDAARCFARAGLMEKAARLYEYLHRWAEAADCYEQAEVFSKAGALYIKAGKLKEAARCIEMTGDHVSAGALFERLKDWDGAGQAYIAAGKAEKAAQCFENGQNWPRAQEIYRRLEDWYRLARTLESTGDLLSAAQYYVQVAAWQDAAHCYERLERWALASDTYLKANNLGSAALMLLKLGRRLDACRLFLLLGQHKVALETASGSPGLKSGRSEDLRRQLCAWADEVGRFDLSAMLYESLGDIEMAAGRYKQAMMLGRAAELLEKASRFDLAADLWMQEGNFEKAAACFKQCKQWRKAASCYELLKKWNEARAMYEQLRDREGIARCLAAESWL